MDILRVGFVGLGAICRLRHIPGLRRLPDIEICAVANRSRESSERAAREFNVPRVYESWQELVSSPDIDVVFVGTWPYLHKAVSIAALESGKHVFCQARMAMNGEEAGEMYKAAQRSGCVAALCPVPIGLTVDATIRGLMQSGWLGEVRYVQVQSLSGVFADPATPMNWRKDRRFSGLNMHTFGMYVEVMHRWFGWTKSISATMDTFYESRVDEGGATHSVEVPDQILCTARMEAGFPIQYAFSTVAHHGSDTVWIYGSRATLRYDVSNDKLYGGLAGATLSEVRIQEADAYDLAQWRVEEDFVNAIRRGTEYHPNFLDGLKYMQVVQAAYDSAHARGEIEIPAISG
ncbi:MAG: Gfo/Idh/MocA family oxidoreductase [Candidatus Hydrogenedentes bacterium]|nr:Gfo/Idh/MocA family oxidoreductase [Candidatus Hydrogenedentota bacterium]